MKAKHTPGPWHQPVRYSPEDGCDIPCGAIEDSRGQSIAGCTYGQVPTITAANARLIAAAPETAADRDRLLADNKALRAHLSDVLRVCAESPDFRVRHGSGVSQARTALAKAKP